MKSASDVIDNSINQLSVYPNMVRDFLNLSGNDEIYQYSIFSIEGLEVKNGELKSNSINLEDLNPGIYFISLSGNNDNSEVFKFIKE